MSTAIGYKMAGGGVKYHTAGNGIIGDVSAKVIRYLGNKGVEKLAKIVEGSGYKLSGEGRKRKPGRPRKVGRPKKK